jgi:2-dehydropantoate 2-reductase
MRIAIVGAGGVGGLLAGLLARSGAEVVVVARGAQLQAIRERGIRVDSPLGAFTARVVAAAEDPSALGRADAVLLAVKAWQVAELAPRLAPLLSPGGVVVPLQNGVEAADQLAAALGPDPVAGGVIRVLAWIEGPGAIRHVGFPPAVIMGERGARAAGPSPRLETLAAALATAGVEAKVSTEVERDVWEKFLILEPWSAIATATRAPSGTIRALPETRALHRAALEEVAAVARARAVTLPADAVAKTEEFLDAVPPEATTSMQRDIGAGRPSELEDLVGALIRLGRQSGVPTPVHDALYAVLLPQEAAARGSLRKFPRT